MFSRSHFRNVNNLINIKKRVSFLSDYLTLIMITMLDCILLHVRVLDRVRVIVFNATQQYFNYILAVSFIGGESGENHRHVPSQ